MTVSLRSIVLGAACIVGTVAAAGAQNPPRPAPANQPPHVTAYCDPCTVEVGQTSTMHAYAKDPNRKALTVKWAATAGTFTNAADRNTVWTAPTQEGAVQVTVTATNGKEEASDTVTIQVVTRR